MFEIELGSIGREHKNLIDSTMEKASGHVEQHKSTLRTRLSDNGLSKDFLFLFASGFGLQQF